ncbi:MAG: hypothetical protein ACC645_08865 [Pirellulales bacterium]
MEPDPLREIRDIRRQISKECGDDPAKVFEYYMAHQQKMKSTGKFKFVTKPMPRVPAALATENDAREPD